MSFFDEADEPAQSREQQRVDAVLREAAIRRGRRPPQAATSSRSGPAGDRRGRRPRSSLILIVLGVHSCQVSARNSSLKDYANNVASINQESMQTGQQFFNQLSRRNGSRATRTDAPEPAQRDPRSAPTTSLATARRTRCPRRDEGGAVELRCSRWQMRRDGIADIAPQIQPALGTTTSKDAVNAIAAEMARFYASDVVYKDYTAPLIAGALQARRDRRRRHQRRADRLAGSSCPTSAG